jgi:hypothetical protein
MGAEPKERKAFTPHVPEASCEVECLVDMPFGALGLASKLALCTTELHEPEGKLTWICSMSAGFDIGEDGRHDVLARPDLGAVKLVASVSESSRCGVCSSQVPCIVEVGARVLPCAEACEQTSETYLGLTYQREVLRNIGLCNGVFVRGSSEHDSAELMIGPRECKAWATCLGGVGDTARSFFGLFEGLETRQKLPNPFIELTSEHSRGLECGQQRKPERLVPFALRESKGLGKIGFFVDQFEKCRFIKFLA